MKIGAILLWGESKKLRTIIASYHSNHIVAGERESPSPIPGFTKYPQFVSNIITVEYPPQSWPHLTSFSQKAQKGLPLLIPNLSVRPRMHTEDILIS